MDAPISFHVDLDPDLFTLDKIDSLFKRAPEGKRDIWYAGFSKDHVPEATGAQLKAATVAEDLATQKLHLRVKDLTSWAPEYKAAREQVLEAAGIDPSAPRYSETTAIRLFSAGAVTALHADGETQFNVGVGGRNVWHVYQPSVISTAEAESILRGQRFMGWRESEPFATYDLGIGDGFAAPQAWPHWIEHPGDEPAVSFELGLWTPENLRVRKVWDINWMLRKLGRSPLPAGENEKLDARKRAVFDLISLVTRRGNEYRGV
jgi:hypothetical protein